MSGELMKVARSPHPALAPFVTPPASGKLFHYTDARGLLGMLNEREIWATDCRYLNDASEFSFGHERVREYVYMTSEKQLAPLLEKALRLASGPVAGSLLVACFSEVDDDLSQWRAYSNGSAGFSIGFDAGQLALRAKLGGFHLARVLYDEAQHAQLADAAATAVIEDARLAHSNQIDELEFLRRAFLNVTLASAMMKHGSFAAERESRLIGIGPYHSSLHWKCRPGKGMLLPYGTLALDLGTSDHGVIRSNSMPISSVRLGPTAHRDLSLGSVRLLLEEMDLYIEISESAIPYRNW